MSDIAVQASFNSGEWAPALFARVDIAKYRSGAALLENFFVDYRGGASTRPGTRFVGPARDGPIRLIPFQETSTLGYILVFTDHAIQFAFRGSMITENPFNISAATQANPAVITVVSNNFNVGDLIFVTGVGGMVQLNSRYFLVAAVAGSSVTLNNFLGDPVDSTAFNAYTSGGTAARIYTLPSPYAGADLASLKYAQYINEMVICSPKYAPYILTIIQANQWTINPIVIGATIGPPGSVTITTSLSSGSVNYAYVVTTVDSNGQESVASAVGTLGSVQDIRTTAGTNQVAWSAVQGAVYYNVYKADVSYLGAVPAGQIFGFIGFSTSTSFIDSNIAPDFTTTPPIATNPFAGFSINTVTVTASGTYTTVPTVSASGSPSMPAVLQAVLTIHGTPTVGSGGSGYVVGDFVQFPNFVGLTVASVGGGGAVTSWQPAGYLGDPVGFITSGSTPSNPVTSTSSTGAGTGATANLTWGVGQVLISSGGLGYTATPTISFSTGAAAATATLSAGVNGNPTVPAFFQERLVLAATTLEPQTVWMSRSGQFFNFNVSAPTRSDDSVQFTLVSGTLNTIKSIVSTTAGMLVLTDNASWIVNGGSSGAAITPSAIVANAQSYIGANDVRPIIANYDVLFPQEKGSGVRDLAFNIYFNVFTGQDISIISSHLFFGFQITEWAWAEEPFKIVWAVRNDGILLSLTFMKEQEFSAWAHHTTNGTFESVAVVTEPDEEVGNIFVDAPYLAVQRTVLTG